MKFQSCIQKKRNLNLVPKMSFWVPLGQNLKKRRSYLKSGPSNLPKRKSLCYKKTKFGTKFALFGYFWTGI